jgi:hypothetical protein
LVVNYKEGAKERKRQQREQQEQNVQGPSVHMNADRECSVDEGVWGHMKKPAGTGRLGSNCTD